MAKQEAKRGRPSKYNSALMPKLAEMMARMGMIDKDMAVYIGIAESTFHKWKKDHPEFADALTIGKEEPDGKVEAALYTTALGTTYDEITQQRKPNPETGEEVVTGTVLTRRHVAPSVAAQIFWLKNRRPDRWRDKQELDIDMENDPLLKFAEGLAAFRLDDKEQ